MTDEKTTCPYCKEDIKAGAIKCKHCHSKLAEDHPAHEGVCPYCKEEIKPDAVKCKHCKSSLVASSTCGCSDNEVVETSDIQALRIGRQPGFTIGDYQECYLDCSFDYPEGSLGQNVCFHACDRRWKYPLPFTGGSFAFSRR